jgi:hypothetical protein
VDIYLLRKRHICCRGRDRNESSDDFFLTQKTPLTD